MKRDPFAWLEQVRSPRALTWVSGQNRRTAARLETDLRYETFRREALSILTAEDRIAYPSFLGDRLANLWQDRAHPKGVWRATSADSYRTETPAWETLIDLDALSKAEGRSWFFKGAVCLPPEDRLCLVRLSDGGGDAVEIREFDTRARRFVSGGFRLPMGKQSADWLDADSLLVAADFGPGAMTTSGYPRSVRILKRGQTLTEAREVYGGEAEDVLVAPRVLRRPDGSVGLILIDRAITFFTSEHRVLSADGSLRRLDLPLKSNLHGWAGGRLILTLNEPWAAGPGRPAFVAGDLIAVEPVGGETELILHPSASQTIDDVAVTRDHVLVSLLDDVNGRVEVFARGDDGAWNGRRLDLPRGGAVRLVDADRTSEAAFLVSESFLEPPVLWSLDAASGALEAVKRLPARFDASRDIAEQHFAVSADGTRIPYYLVRPRTMVFDGTTPTLMFGYGGFRISETPSYLPELGKLWLERGGAYVLANIRGGGEYGPAWHEAAMREKRQRAFDDFAAVARDLIARGVTSPRRLGIYGRSNGGILTSVSITQHPELFHAAVIESPLIDMLAYTRLPPGASWIGEYGDPEQPADRESIAAWSAYQNLKPGVDYPEPYVTTNTEDDRVHPGHARKFAAGLQALGRPCLYYENTIGGHANDADPELNARRWARHYVYLSQKLMDGPRPPS